MVGRPNQRRHIARGIITLSAQEMPPSLFFNAYAASASGALVHHIKHVSHQIDATSSSAQGTQKLQHEVRRDPHWRRASGFAFGGLFELVTVGRSRSPSLRKRRTFHYLSYDYVAALSICAEEETLLLCTYVTEGSCVEWNGRAYISRTVEEGGGRDSEAGERNLTFGEPFYLARALGQSRPFLVTCFGTSSASGALQIQDADPCENTFSAAVADACRARHRRPACYP